MKLYRNSRDLDYWYVPAPRTGWMRFPAKINGWKERRPVFHVEAIDLREVPLRLGFDTGLPGTARSRRPYSPGLARRSKAA